MKMQSFLKSPDEKPNEDRKLIKFLRAEISWIKGNGIKNREEYMTILRSGRGNQVKIFQSAS